MAVAESFKQLKLAFSGGGLRSTFYCLGGYRRLVELGVEGIVSQISSVSGGSITAGVILTALREGHFRGVEDFDARVTEPLKRFGQAHIRRKLYRRVLRSPKNRAALFPRVLDEQLFHGVKMAELPLVPKWTCNATCLNTQKRFRFQQDEMYGYLVGKSHDTQEIPVSFAVAASAAFPFLLFAPIELHVKKKGIRFSGIDGYEWSKEASQPDVLYLSDGGVYDNLGSEEFLKGDRKDPYLIFDASAEGDVWSPTYQPDKVSFLMRTLDASTGQNVYLRRRLLYLEKRSGGARGAQLILSKPIADAVASVRKNLRPVKELPAYGVEHEALERLLAGLRTDLDAFHDVEIALLMWAGAVRMDLAVKALFPELIQEEQWHDVPTVDWLMNDRVRDILQIGQQRSLLRRLHKVLTF